MRGGSSLGEHVDNSVGVASSLRLAGAFPCSFGNAVLDYCPSCAYFGAVEFIDHRGTA